MIWFPPVFPFPWYPAATNGDRINFPGHLLPCRIHEVPDRLPAHVKVFLVMKGKPPEKTYSSSSQRSSKILLPHSVFSRVSVIRNPLFPYRCRAAGSVLNVHNTIRSYFFCLQKPTA